MSETAGPGRHGVSFFDAPAERQNESGLGKDMQDFSASLIGQDRAIDSHRRERRPADRGRPHPGRKAGDLFAFGLSLARAVTKRWRLWASTPAGCTLPTLSRGTENRGAFRFGGRFTHRSVRIDAAIVLGATPRDPEFGLSAGATWVFNAFKVP